MTQVDGEGDRPSLHGGIRVERVCIMLCDWRGCGGERLRRREFLGKCHDISLDDLVAVLTHSHSNAKILVRCRLGL